MMYHFVSESCLDLLNTYFHISLPTEGNILDAMANAVEKSACVLICMSERYKDSYNCRSGKFIDYRMNRFILNLTLYRTYNALNRGQKEKNEDELMIKEGTEENLRNLSCLPCIPKRKSFLNSCDNHV